MKLKTFHIVLKRSLNSSFVASQVLHPLLKHGADQEEPTQQEGGGQDSTTYDD